MLDKKVCQKLSDIFFGKKEEITTEDIVYFQKTCAEISQKEFGEEPGSQNSSLWLVLLMLAFTMDNSFIDKLDYIK